MLRRIILSALLIWLYGASYGQNADTAFMNKDYLPFDTVIAKLQHEYSIRFFYNPAWFEGVKINPQIIKDSLPEAIASLKQITKLEIIKVNDRYYTFVAASKDENANSIENGKVVIIGDLLHYGSKKIVKMSGTVIDATNNMPLHGAIIFFSDLHKTLQTDIDGKYSLSIPVGEHAMKITFPGFLENSKSLRVLSDGTLTVEMFDKAINVNEVVVTSNRIDQNFRRTQMSIVKLQSRNIRELPNTLGEIDIIKSLSLLPGVETTGDFGSGFNVRGGSSDQNLILIEDVPVFNSAHMFGLLSIINSDAITDVTLYKGGIPASYGERASSVLNIDLGSEDLEKPRVKVGVSLIDSRLNIELPIGKKITLMAGGRTTYSDWLLKSIPDDDLMNSSAGFNDVYGLLTITPNQKSSLTLFGYQSNDRFKFAGTEYYAYGNLLGSVKFMHRFSNTLFTSLMAGTSYYRASYTQNDTLTPIESTIIHNSILYRSLKWNFVYELNTKNVITAGINAFLYNSRPGTLMPYGEDSRVSEVEMQQEQGLETAAFLSDDIKFNESLSCEVGLRVSAFSEFGPKEVYLYFAHLPVSTESFYDSTFYKNGRLVKPYMGIEPRLSFQYNFLGDNSIKLSYNRINQYINLISNTSVITPSSIWKLSDTYIKPVISDQVAVGYFRNFVNNKYEASVEVYYKTYQHVVEYKNGATVLLNPQIETELTYATGKNYGAEILLKKNGKKLSGWLSYTYSRALRRTSSGYAEDQINNNRWFPDDQDKPHNLVLNGNYYPTRRLRLSATYTFTSGRPVTLPEQRFLLDGYQLVYYSERNKYRMPEYERLDLAISRSESLRIRKKWKGYWTVSVINVLGRRNAYSIFYQKTASQFALNSSAYNLYKLYIIGRPLPTFTYNIVF